MKGMRLKILMITLVSVILLTGCYNRGQNVVCIEIWHHYEGMQKIAFDNLISKFNSTEGMNKGIIVEGFSQGTKDELENKLANSINGKVGYDKVPNIFAGDPYFVSHLDNVGVIVNIEDYMKRNEINDYISTYIKEGYIGDDNKLKMIPVGKSTEVLMINKTDWDKFERATGTSLDELESWEGVARVAEKYYNWTDSLTTGDNKGKAFFSRDNMANYILAASQQLSDGMFIVNGDEVKVQIDSKVMRKIWDNYYIPYINGYYGPFGRDSVSDLKTGKIIAYVASTGEITNFPDRVTTEDNKSYKIEPLILPLPNFSQAKPCVSLEGEGMSVLKSDEAQERASVEFLKWFTNPSNNIEFTAATGFLPVTKTFNSSSDIENKLMQLDIEKIPNIIEYGLPITGKQVEEYDLYINKSFKNSLAARNVLTSLLTNRSKGDRRRVLELMGEGMTKNQAVQEVATDSNFEQWLVRFKMEVKGVIN